MPYIKANDGRREALRKGEPALNAGELNYQIFYYVKHNRKSLRRYQEYWDNYKIIKKFVDNFLGKTPNYQKYNDMTGALIRCHKEALRRLQINADHLLHIMRTYDDEIAKYEDIKIQENSDVE